MNTATVYSTVAGWCILRTDERRHRNPVGRIIRLTDTGAAISDISCVLMIDATIRLSVPARVYTSDRAKYAEFDASEWLARASAEQILALASSGWGGSEASRDVAGYARGREDAVADVFQYAMYVCHGGLPCSCCCEVDAVAALEWLAYRKPEVLTRVRALPNVA